jgi:sigma-E factor negative regulatory protein RseA
MNRDDDESTARRRRCLSSLMDGDAQEADEGCRAFAHDASARSDWHAYHVIGDVMRSADTVRSPAEDAAFLGRLRERLEREPAVLAPTPVRRAPRRAWLAPAAVAAGFMVVAGALIVTRVSVPDGNAGSDRLARDGSGGTTPVVASLDSSAASASAVAVPADGVLLRSAELDRYLAAHRQYAPMSTLAAPGGIVRSAAVAAPGR